MRPLVVCVAGERAADGRYGRAPDGNRCRLLRVAHDVFSSSCAAGGWSKAAWLLEAARDALLFSNSLRLPLAARQQPLRKTRGSR